MGRFRDERITVRLADFENEVNWKSKTFILSPGSIRDTIIDK